MSGENGASPARSGQQRRILATRSLACRSVQPQLAHHPGWSNDSDVDLIVFSAARRLAFLVAAALAFVAVPFARDARVGTLPAMSGGVAIAASRRAPSSCSSGRDAS